MATTNNGWPKDPAVTRVYCGNDSNGCEFASGDVAVVMEQFFNRFHQTVEPVTALNGYRSTAFNNTLPGSSKTSNHISGTAGDVNGARHPNEYAHGGKLLGSGFTSAQIARIRLLQNEFLGLIAWGGDYRPGIRDYMHFEIRATRAQIRNLAAQIIADRTPAPVPTPTPEPGPVPDETPEAVMPYPRFYKMTGTNLAYEDLGTARRRVTQETFMFTFNQYPGKVAIIDLPVNDAFFNLPIVGDDSYGEGYRYPNHHEVWVDASKDGLHGRRYVDASTYAQRGGFGLVTLAADHAFWNLPIIGTNPNG